VQICIPYLDPALVQSRQKIFQLTYGFDCACPSCMFTRRIRIPEPPEDSGQLAELERLLCRVVFSSDTWFCDLTFSHPTYDEIPSSLYPMFHESYLTGLSERFSKSSHDGPYETALEVGYSLLALYMLIYAPNYPQIGVSALASHCNSIDMETLCQECICLK
jgi:hypothetical protein